jgi:hypothetical protein
MLPPHPLAVAIGVEPDQGILLLFIQPPDRIVEPPLRVDVGNGR